MIDSHNLVSPDRCEYMSYVTVMCRFVSDFAYETHPIMELTWIAILAMFSANKIIFHQFNIVCRADTFQGVNNTLTLI